MATAELVSSLEKRITMLLLKREDWDFSDLPKDEYNAALRWELLRESPLIPPRLAEAGAWLDGNLSRQEPISQPAHRSRIKRQGSRHLSEEETAIFRIGAAFQNFIPFGEFKPRPDWNRTQWNQEYAKWLASHIRPLVLHNNGPWLCLPQTERGRLSKIIQNARSAPVVSIPNWPEACQLIEAQQKSPGLPVLFAANANPDAPTIVLLKIDWSFSKKRILAAFKKILDEHGPATLEKFQGRGKKLRDKLVVLERLAIMRLLHHYTREEVRLKLPDAWNLYGTRKWYDERRRARDDFRRYSNLAEPAAFLPLSWETKANISRKTGQ